MIFRIQGVNRQTSQPVEMELDAPDLDSARQAAEQMEIQVQKLFPAGEVSQVLTYQSPGTPSGSGNLRLRYFGLMFAIEFFLAMLGMFLLLHGGSDGGAVVFTFFISMTVLALLQWLMVWPVTRPGGSAQRPRPFVFWFGALAFGLIAGAGILIIGLLLADVAWVYGASDRTHDNLALIALIVAFTSWLVTTPLLVAFMKRRRPHTVLARISAALFLGTAVEFVAAIPILGLVRRKNSCECETYTFGSLVLAFMVGVVLLGPMILLVIAARRSRIYSRGYCAACGHDMSAQASRDRCEKCGCGWVPPETPKTEP